MAEGSDSVEWMGRRVPVDRAEILGSRVRLEVFRLYWVDGRTTSSQYVAKALLAWSKLSGHGDDAALIVMYTPIFARRRRAARDAASVRVRHVAVDRAIARGVSLAVKVNPVPAPLIVHVVYRFGVGGLENGVVNLINRLPSQSWRHAVLSLTEIDPAFSARVVREDVHYTALRKGPGPRNFALSEAFPAVPRIASCDRPHAQPCRTGSNCARVGGRRPRARPRRARARRGGSGRLEHPASMGAPRLQPLRDAIRRVVAGPRALFARSASESRRIGSSRSTTAWTRRASARRLRQGRRSKAAPSRDPIAGSWARSVGWRRSRTRAISLERSFAPFICTRRRGERMRLVLVGDGALRPQVERDPGRRRACVTSRGSRANARTSPICFKASTASFCPRWPKAFRTRYSRPWPRRCPSLPRGSGRMANSSRTA